MPDTAIKFIEIVIRFIKNPKLKFVIIPVSWVLLPLTFIISKIPFIQLTNISLDIKKLEKAGKFREARKLRQDWLNNPKFSNSGLLWCSEGNDLLYKKKEYNRALAAYERAEKLEPGINPFELYFGASIAAVKADNLEKVKKNFENFKYWVEKFKDDPKFENYLSQYKKGIQWIEMEISNHKKTNKDSSHSPS